ncbi:hypothetical protein [Saccharomonospora glauca]|jgi:hypothetical protein|uniref:Uncharacterized protein n=1 Tax=Saccharomonospora glauca K62 TaxID=928724 RepID=I1D3M7_9PSEU|nr:hypothetical protein [Saccharomonospora glauca]EIE99551.1 hypothetical protein SacglDRAFT_02659 [Saccharomonospora glauca K62]
MSAETGRSRQLLARIGLTLLDDAPERWRRIDLQCRAVADVHDVTLTVLLEDGSQPDMTLPPHVVDDLLEVRRLTYRPDMGAWFSMRYLLDPPAQMYVKYNYDWDPKWRSWRSPIPAESWARDLEAFPRPEENIPDWLAERIAEANRER